MKFKRIMLIAVILIFLTAGAVSASDDNQTDLTLANSDIQEMSVDEGVLKAPSTDEVLDISQDVDVLEVSLNQSDEVLGFSTSRINVWFSEEPYIVLDRENDFWILNDNRVEFPKESAIKIVAKDLNTGKTYSDSVPTETIHFEYGMDNIHYMVYADMFKKIPWTAKHKYLVKVYWVSPEGKAKGLGKQKLQVKVNTKDLKVYANDITTHLYSGEKYGVTVYKSNGQLATNVEVELFINDKPIQKVKTNSKGVAYFDIPQKVKTYRVNAYVSSLKSSSALYKIKVTHSIDLPRVAVKKSAKSLTIKVTLKKIKGKILKGQKITLNFNGNKYVKKTNKYGVAKFTIVKSVLKKLKAGKAIKYKATYLKDTASRKVKVQK
ncbi:hypothetical protein [Methanobrevibacter sp.]|uniref:hypothetical protein n=1 Tax=Methanobrevibacter sp. TaxID=66852 RepID=UPI00388D244C